MAEGFHGAHTRTPRQNRCLRRGGAYSCSLHAPAHMDYCVVSDISTMLGAGFRAGRAACYFRVPGTGISFTAPRFRSHGCRHRRRGNMGHAGTGRRAAGIHLGGLAACGKAPCLAWDLPRLSLGSAPGQTRLAASGPRNPGEPLQHRGRRPFHHTRVALPGRAPQPKYSAHRYPLHNLGLPCPTGLVYAVPSPCSTGRVRPVRAGHVSRHEAAFWYLHASLALPFLSLCLSVVYRVVGLCTDFRQACSRLGWT